MVSARALEVIIKGVESNLVTVAIGQVDIDREPVPRKPSSGNAVDRVLGLLQGR